MKKNEYVSSQTEVAVGRPLILDERVRLEDNHENQKSKIPKSWEPCNHRSLGAGNLSGLQTGVGYSTARMSESKSYRSTLGMEPLRLKRASIR
jgi:hypothetical protein